MAYHIDFTDEARGHLRALDAGERAALLHAIREQLVHQPATVARNRKRMDPDKRYYVAPWELRVGRLRVYYSVDDRAASVVIFRIGIKDRDRVLIGGEPLKP